MRVCRDCKKLKPLDQYYEARGALEGRRRDCKECTKKAVRENRELKFEQYKAYDAARDKDPARIAKRASYGRTRTGRKAHARAAKAYRVTH